MPGKEFSCPHLTARVHKGLVSFVAIWTLQRQKNIRREESPVAPLSVGGGGGEISRASEAGFLCTRDKEIKTFCLLAPPPSPSPSSGGESMGKRELEKEKEGALSSMDGRSKWFFLFRQWYLVTGERERDLGAPGGDGCGWRGTIRGHFFV